MEEDVLAGNRDGIHRSHGEKGGKAKNDGVYEESALNGTWGHLSLMVDEHDDEHEGVIGYGTSDDGGVGGVVDVWIFYHIDEVTA